jgi:hypothetical protein
LGGTHNAGLQLLRQGHGQFDELSVLAGGQVASAQSAQAVSLLQNALGALHQFASFQLAPLLNVAMSLVKRFIRFQTNHASELEMRDLVGIAGQQYASQFLDRTVVAAYVANPVLPHPNNRQKYLETDLLLYAAGTRWLRCFEASFQFSSVRPYRPVASLAALRAGQS